MPVVVEKIQDLFEQPSVKDNLKESILEDAKHKIFVGVLDSNLTADFEPSDGSDILITEKLIDPKKALGYKEFDSVDDYYDDLNAELYVPSAEDLGQGRR